MILKKRNSFFLYSFHIEGYTGHIEFNEYGERINYTLNVYQVTMNKLPRNVIDNIYCLKEIKYLFLFV